MTDRSFFVRFPSLHENICGAVQCAYERARQVSGCKLCHVHLFYHFLWASTAPAHLEIINNPLHTFSVISSKYQVCKYVTILFRSVTWMWLTWVRVTPAHGPWKESRPRPLLHRKLNIQPYKSGSLPKVVRKRERLDIWMLYLPSYFSPRLVAARAGTPLLALTFRIFFYETFPLLKPTISFFFLSQSNLFFSCQQIVNVRRGIA